MLSTSKADTTRVLLLYRLSNAYTWIDVDTSDIYVDQALRLAHQLDFTKGLSFSYNQKGTVAYVRADYETAIVWMDSSLVLRKVLNDKTGEIRMINNIAFMYSNLNRTEEAMQMYHSGLKVATQDGMDEVSGNLKNNIGLLHYHVRALDSALFYFSGAAESFKKAGKHDQEALAINNIGNAYYYKKDYLNALNYYKDANALAREIEDTRTTESSQNNLAILYDAVGMPKEALAISKPLLASYKDDKVRLGALLNNLANYNLALNNLDTALWQANQSIALKRESNASELGLAYVTLAKIHFAQGQKEEGLRNARLALNSTSSDPGAFGLASNLLAEALLDEGKIREAEDILRKANDQLKDSDLIDVLADNNLFLSEVYEGLGDAKRSLKHYKTAFSLRDSILNSDKVFALARSAIEFDTQRKEYDLTIKSQEVENLSVQLLLEKAERRQLFFWITGGVLFIIIIGLWRLKSLKDGKLQALKEKEQYQLISDNESLRANSLQKELELKDKGLIAQALSMVEKNEILTEFKNNIRKDFNEEEKLKIQRTIDSLEKSFHISENGWENFRKSFEAVHESFFKNLSETYDHLSPRDLQICALLRLNLSTKEMSSLLAISKDSVKKARYRIRKKLDLNDSDHNLTSFLMKF